MRCHRVQRLLPDYIGDELSLKEREQVKGHLEGCRACKEELEALGGVWDRLAQQTLPQKEEGFWQGFTARVMKDVRKRRLMPEEKRTPLFFPGWRVLLPAAGAAAAAIAVVVMLKGGLLPGHGPAAGGTVAELTQPFAVAPVAGEDEYPVGGGISLNGGAGLAEGEGVALQPRERAVLTEALTQLAVDEDLSGQLEELDEEELEQFERLLSARYPLS